MALAMTDGRIAWCTPQSQCGNRDLLRLEVAFACVKPLPSAISCRFDPQLHEFEVNLP